ncbi:MAG TPA: chloride channel protein [Bryobacteraceae bacterium]|nr:chloride channel protein [Bryobacteraceae bacterium]
MTMVLAVAVSILIGLVTIAFILVTGRRAARLYPAGGAEGGVSWFRPSVPFTGFLLAKYFPCARGSGIPQGREGPSVRVGAGIASVLGRNLGLSRKQVKALLTVGCADGAATHPHVPRRGRGSGTGARLLTGREKERKIGVFRGWFPTAG